MILEQLARTLTSFVKARTWDESQRIVEQHPELLREVVDVWLEQLGLRNPTPRLRLLEMSGTAAPVPRRGYRPRLRGAGGRRGTAAPPAFADDQRTAQEAETYLGTGDRAALDSAAAAWSRMLGACGLFLGPEPFRLPALNNAAVSFCATTGRADASTNSNVRLTCGNRR